MLLGRAFWAKNLKHASICSMLWNSKVTTHSNKIDWIPLERRRAPILLRRHGRQARAIKHSVAMPFRVVCF